MADYLQSSFRGGMNLFVDDTRLADNEYREAFNVRNRFDVLEQIKAATEDVAAPAGLKQGMHTFGQFKLLFVAGLCYYQNAGSTGWTKMPNFLMTPTASRVYLKEVPIGTTNYGRKLADATDVYGGVKQATLLLSSGNVEGLLVQDGITQAWFIYNDGDVLAARRTQTYDQWAFDPTGVADKREYVPIGTFMEWYDGILYTVDPTFTKIYRSVTGRPLDYVVAVDVNGDKAGDANATAFSVGVGGITCIKTLNNQGLFIACANRFCYFVTPDKTPQGLKIFGEPTYIRQYLFDSGCVNERVFVDILGDFAFIDPEGLRSFNAVLQQQNEGRNSIFSLKVAALFKDVLQVDEGSSAIVFDNYALFSVNTIYGNVILVYDTLNQCYVGMDTQTNGVAIKQFAKIDTDVTELFAITTDNRLLRLYIGNFEPSAVRTKSWCSQIPINELTPEEFRVVLNGFRKDSVITTTCFVNNRRSGDTMTKMARFTPSPKPFTGEIMFSDVDSQLANFMFNYTSANQGWKAFFLVEWTGGGSITNFSLKTNDVTTKNPLMTQAASV